MILFKLNMKNPYVKSLAELFDKLIDEAFKKTEIKRDKLVVEKDV